MNDGIIDSTAQTADSLQVSPSIREYLRETAKWAKFLAIVMFVAVALMLLGAVIMLVSSSLIPSEFTTMTGINTGVFSLAYILGALLYFMPALYLYRFAARTQAALKSEDQFQFQEGFENLKSHYKFIGILVAIILVFYLLFFVFAIFAGVLMG